MTEKILIIEDDRSLSADIEIILSFFDYKVEVINRVDEIIKVKNFDKYKCIMLDIMMKTEGQLNMDNFKESGEAAYSYIRSKSKNTPIIIMSAMDKEDISINFTKQNVFYIKKPFSGMDQLVEMVTSI
jgi:DNA-binding NtrC family response regulator